jgi:hypothetical protein
VRLARADLAGEEHFFKKGRDAESLQDGMQAAVKVGEDKEAQRCTLWLTMTARVLSQLLQGRKGVLVELPRACLREVRIHLGEHRLECGSIIIHRTAGIT